ncbi:lipopolysaccharide biosynthesis protein [Hymenobacter baengnokdamensis]|uniref:lipopolysaccharide biosynthesis protein n=1 Tax=Hymenobacter baengnokdamensis TaxID=2615203 RepID=UPI001246279A|nr:oligosaccharide flippase family protein [Hymenobacter baengnokdamensis]
MTNVSRSKAAFWGTISTQAYTIISMAVSIVSTPLMIRYLDKEAYGLSIIFYQIINYLSLFDFGLSTAVNRQLALHRADNEQNRLMLNRIISTAMVTGGVFGLITILGGCLFAPYLPGFYHLRPDLAAPAVPIVMTLSLVIAGQFMQRGLGSIFYAHHRQALIGTPLFIVSILTTGVTIGLLANGYGLWSFMYANLFQFSLTLILQIGMVRRYYPYLRVHWRFFDKELVHTMMGYGFFMFLHGLAAQVILFTDRLVIGKILTLSLVTIFSITVRIPEVGMNLLTSILGNAVPALAEIAVHEGEERIRLNFERMMVLMVSLSMLACWSMLLLDDWFIHLWVGSSFFAGISTLILALIVMVQQTITRTGVQFLDARGIVQASSLAAIIEAVLNITISVALGRVLGLNGILLGTILAALVTSSWYVPYLLHKHLGVSLIQYFWHGLAKPVLGVSLIGIFLYEAVHVVREYLPTNWSSFLVVASVVGGTLSAFVWILYLRGPLGHYVPQRLRRVLLVPPMPVIPV